MGIVNAIRASYGALHILSGLSGLLNLFCRRFDRQKNCAVRAAADLPRGLLNGQALSPLADLPYGAWTMGNNGCEVIAVCNALFTLGRPTPLAEVAAELEAGGLLFNGFGGTNPAALPRFFRRRGIRVSLLRRRARKRYDAALTGADCAILSYWTGARLRRADGSWHTLHTVSVQRCPGCVMLTNVCGQCREPVTAPSLTEFLSSQGAVSVCLLALNG